MFSNADGAEFRIKENMKVYAFQNSILGPTKYEARMLHTTQHLW
jgi:hypothetical protein